MGLDLKARVSLDGSGFEAGVKRLEHAGKEAFSELKQFALQAFGAYGAERMFHKSIEDAKELVNAAKRLGTDGVEGLQVLRQAAKDSSTDLETVEKAFEKINIARSKVLNKGKGWEEMAAGFKGLGVNDLTMSTQAMLLGPIRNSAMTMNPANFEPLMKAATGLKTVGELIPFLTTDFEELEGKMRRMGAMIDMETAVKLKMMGDELDIVGQILTSKFGPILLQVVEALMKAFAFLSGLVAGAVGGVQGAVSGKWDAARVAKAVGLFASGGLTGVIPGMNPFNGGEAKKGASELAWQTWNEWIESFDELEKKMAALRDRLLHPNPPSFEETSPLEKAQRVSGAKIDSADSLVRVGNFLGDSQGTLVSIAERHLAETKAMHNTLKSMRGGLSQNTSQQDPAFG